MPFLKRQKKEKFNLTFNFEKLEFKFRLREIGFVFSEFFGLNSPSMPNENHDDNFFFKDNFGLFDIKGWQVTMYIKIEIIKSKNEEFTFKIKNWNFSIDFENWKIGISTKTFFKIGKILNF